ncbi:MAG TPA: aminomethyl transferase family protein [Allosphingosinicella sp.]|nr:aminomethyl transferase family protein [Allosphingosinicella sp.]
MKSLQDLISSKPNLVEYLYNDTVAQMHKSRANLFASKNLIEREYTSWRDEHRAARDTCVITNQSHHMPTLYVKGPDAKRMLQYLSPCSFSNLSTERGKQYFACTPRGHHIGDCVMHYYGEEGGFELISGMPLLNWVRFNAETGDYDVDVVFEPTTPFNPTGKRSRFRFQVEGPNAGKILDEVTEGGWPELKFFATTNVTMAGVPVHVLRHSMSATGGAEIDGPYEHLDTVQDAILKAGEKHGIRQGGTLTYFSNGVLSGWIPYPLPGIYTGADLRAYREWLTADSWEANMQLAGSFYSDNIEDYYWTPSALGYDRFVKFDHDFIGREAIEAALSKPRRVKRLLRWNKEDILKVHGSQFSEGPIYKAMDLPTPMYGWPQADEVRTPEGKLIGMSQYCAYSLTPRDLISMCCLDEEHAEVGSEVVVTWGEVNGGSRKPHVEKHVQTTIRATVCEAPYSKVIRD